MYCKSQLFTKIVSCDFRTRIRLLLGRLGSQFSGFPVPLKQIQKQVHLGTFHVSFLTARRWTCQFFRACFQEPFLYRFLNRNFNSWDYKFEVFAWKILQKSTFHQNRFLRILDSNSIAFGEPWEPIFRFSGAFKTNSKTAGFLVVSNVLFKAPGSCQ